MIALIQTWNLCFIIRFHSRIDWEGKGTIFHIRVSIKWWNICSFWLETLCQLQKKLWGKLLFPEEKCCFFWPKGVKTVFSRETKVCLRFSILHADLGIISNGRGGWFPTIQVCHFFLCNEFKEIANETEKWKAKKKW